MNATERVVRLIVIGFLLPILCWSCSGNRKADVTRFLDSIQIKGIPPGNILHAAASNAINRDYTNKVYFLIAQIDRNGFEAFVQHNSFTKEEFLSLPKRGDDWPKSPDWWPTSLTQDEKFSKKVGNSLVIVTWSDGKLYLYGND